MLVLTLCLGGCQTDNLTAKQRQELSSLNYPKASGPEINKDIVVTRDGDRINLVNRTPRTYDNMELWLNRRYVSKVKKIAIGTHNPFDLSTFINLYDQPFPTAQFLAPDKAADLVSAELYNPKTKKKYSLVVLEPLQIENAARARGQSVNKINNGY